MLSQGKIFVWKISFVMFSQGVSREKILEQICAVSPDKTDCEISS